MSVSYQMSPRWGATHQHGVAPVNDHIDNYIIEREIGRGSFGSVYLTRSRVDGQKYALKKLLKNVQEKHAQLLKVQNEIRAGQKLDHRNIVKFYRYFEDDTSYFLLFEYIQGVDLFTLLESRSFRPFTEQESRTIVQQVVNALLYMHNHGVMHNDIKLDNVMIDLTTYSVKVIDFGLCQHTSYGSGDYFYGACGSDHYFPAEMLERGQHGRYNGVKVDSWCLGVVFHALLTASFPYKIQDRNRLISAGGKHPSVVIDCPMSDSARDLIYRMLTNDPEERISVQEISRHPWLQQAL